MDNKKVYVVGIGPGSRQYILPKAIEIMENSDIVLAFERIEKSITFLNKPIKKVKKLQEILDSINDNKYKTVSIAASGDPNFYGITDYIKRNFNGNVEVVPGITSIQYLSGKLGIVWSKAYVGSMHGREEDFLNIVKDNSVSMWLTDKKNSPQELCKKLCSLNGRYKVYVGENLSYSDEKITVGYAEELIHKDFSHLSVMIIEGESK